MKLGTLCDHMVTVGNQLFVLCCGWYLKVLSWRPMTNVKYCHDFVPMGMSIFGFVPCVSEIGYPV